MTKPKIFLDTPILRRAFVMWINEEDWRQLYHLSDEFELVTSQKNAAEMYGILKTNILESELKVYGLISLKHFRDAFLNGSEFLNIFWHRQILEAEHSFIPQVNDAHSKRFRELVKWRHGYEEACGDFDRFLKSESIEWVHYGSLFAKHEWQMKILDLARDSLIPSEDWEIVVAACFAKADVFLTDDKKLIRFSFSLGLEPVPAFCEPKDLEQKLQEIDAGINPFPSS